MKTISRIVQTLGAVGVVAAAASVVVHPFGAVKIQDAERPVFAGAGLDASTQALLSRTCMNCHSERTVWPWYSHVAPVSWLLERDVREARAHLNASRWDDYSVSKRQALLATVGAAVRNRQVPPFRYTLLHPEAKLSSAEAEQIYRWTRVERKRLRSPVQRSSLLARNE